MLGNPVAMKLLNLDIDIEVGQKIIKAAYVIVPLILNPRLHQQPLDRFFDWALTLPFTHLLSLSA